MNCTKYDDFESGLIEAGEMKHHMESCADCQKQAALDARLNRAAAFLRSPVSDGGLWGRIEVGLLERGAAGGEAKGLAAPAKTRGVQPTGEKTIFLSFLKNFTPGPENPFFFRNTATAALGLAAVGLAAWLLFIRPSPRGGGSGLMAEAALARVEIEEREYAAAIEALEAKAGPKLADMDFSLMALYRDRLETIDAQIERCREAIAMNPWNAHVRTYMLAALQDKKETLGLILSQ